MENTTTEILIPARLKKAAKHFKLSPRQVQVLALAGQGEPRKRVAITLGISIRTVDAHIEKAYRRLKCHTAAHAMLLLLTL